MARYTGAFTPPTASMPTLPVPDSYWQATSMLLHGVGAIGSTVITDSSRNARAYTATNGAFIAAVRNKATGTSLSLPNANSSISTPADASFAFGKGNFTIEAWVYLTSRTNEFCLLSTDTATPNFRFAINTSGVLVAGSGGTTTGIGGSVPLNKWTHVCFQRVSDLTLGAPNGTTYAYVDGLNVGYIALPANLVSTQVVRVGATNVVNNSTGYIADLRVTKHSRYSTGNFTPQIQLLPDASGSVDQYFSKVVLLVSGNPVNGLPVIKDYSGNVLPIGTAVTAEPAPYNPKQVLRLNIPAYPYCDNYAIYYGTTQADVNANVQLKAGVTRAWSDSYNIQELSGLQPNTTYYIRVAPVVNTLELKSTSAITMISAKTDEVVPPSALTLSLNAAAPNSGIDVGWSSYFDTAASVTSYNVYYSLTDDVGYGVAGTSVVSFNSLSRSTVITGLLPNTTYYFKHTVSTGWGESTPTAMASITTGEALTATILDTSSNSLVVTPSGSPTQIANGPTASVVTSVTFNGTTDILNLPASTVFSLGATFTIEFWINVAALPVSARCRIIAIGNNNLSSSLVVELDQMGRLTLGVPLGGSVTVFTTVNSIPVNTWTHYALVNNNGTATIYQNGLAIASATGYTAQTAGTPNLVIGRDPTGTVNAFFQGALANVRIVKGTAVYTANFTPSATPLTAISGTSTLLKMDGV